MPFFTLSHMKIVKHLVLLVLMVSSCAAQQDLSTTQITYMASTRGFYQDIDLTPQKIVVRNQKSSEEHAELPMPQKEWESVLKMCQDLPKKVAGVDQDKLAIDAAVKGILTLKGKDGEVIQEYEIDHNNVPEKMQALMNKIQALASTVE